MIKGNSNKLFQRGSLIVVIILFGLIIAKLFYVAVSPTVDGVDLKAFALTRRLVLVGGQFMIIWVRFLLKMLGVIRL